ncbi:hypothetical protein A2313_00725 [Candidatus Roizmanbacteria bacterium RIFOXYB2_FULL_41_10]|uniref:Non-canonical purine NTP pyrophosphatase n=1 Tax=Candidatus Roizmanbacteria bacterium RIFOXYA1_FULL_41_12 TaxID=1802082 RepID=A0A1F7K956_9BACT|nr:MAG: hypothetical protein A2209_03710 [Candidatus Roizmanbacteria bacterium RIFOXYA1_FULL_41_12]OGK66977.1 MAG: hypothetical protein A2377_03850 [Candidatus Roizmanbacteria bacterium RIFOXYB1_FULL_41_27]OGK67397.1 MAG: hypothetical protein A2262_03065 [Candidatus Roizmanbacteria bacterium RIFOXYA2_FULL_41_8]OGK68850.1 MAG: hypothetical protein A2313_00725 [Candidatus Roizmanbacteria bacterium RIFOXYB2_FULL_41_10]OGK71996.1 MAG: hypothetical protein A2403_03515 [Candidatus Roizmanbacteria bac
MTKLLLATSNPGKLAEMRQGLTDLLKKGWQLLSLADLEISQSPEETGQSFKENAELKARYYAQKTRLPVLADDGGFVIPYLNGEPGVRSARWLGNDSSENNLIKHTLNKLENARDKQRQAYLELVVCFYDPVKEILLFENEKIAGIVAGKPSAKRVFGFPYRALLKVEPFNQYYDELSPKQHFQVNHRLRALKKLRNQLDQYYE